MKRLPKRSCAMWFGPEGCEPFVYFYCCHCDAEQVVRLGEVWRDRGETCGNAVCVACGRVVRLRIMGRIRIDAATAGGLVLPITGREVAEDDPQDDARGTAAASPAASATDDKGGK